jgi:5-hydroxyisourate hydrolase
MSGYLTTHVLDTARGCPAEGIKIELYRLDADRTLIATTVTNDDGRTDSPILPMDAFKTGKYELVFFCSDYLEANDLATGDLKFLDEIPIRFGMDAAEAHSHVPRWLSPSGSSP